MRGNKQHIIAASSIGTVLVGVLIAAPQLCERVASASPDQPQPLLETVTFTMGSMAGLQCENGIIGTTAGKVSGFNVGRYVLVNDHLVLRARAEVQNKPPLGSPDGNEAKFYVGATSAGIGVGSIADVGNPGSQAVSGGGPHGSEIVHMIFYGDALITQPKVVVPASVIIRVSDYAVSSADLSLVLHTASGQTRVYSPAEVEPHLVMKATKVYELALADLPDIATVDSLKRLDVRSGWFDTANNKLTGGHFWLTSVKLVAEEYSPATVPNQIFD